MLIFDRDLETIAHCNGDMAVQQYINAIRQATKNYLKKHLLPEYYSTRTERALLNRCASEIVRLTGACDLIEFGSGSSSKTRVLIEAQSQLDSPLHYCPIDVSADIVKDIVLALLDRYSQLKLSGIAGSLKSSTRSIASSRK